MFKIRQLREQFPARGHREGLDEPVVRRARRTGSTTVEFALTAPLTFGLLLSLFAGGLGVFRYQQVARLARDASRWASVHGSDYATATGNPAATATDVYNQVILPKATLLDLKKLTYSVTWNSSNDPFTTVTINGQDTNVANTVTVTITYQWIPEAMFNTNTMTSSSTSVMTY